MVNQKLVQWVKDSMAKGFTKEQLFDYLSKQGYPPGDVYDALNAVGGPHGSVPPKKKSFPILIIVAVIALVLIGGLLVFLFVRKPWDTIPSQPEQMVDEPDIETMPEEDMEVPPEEEGCSILPDHLDDCTPFVCEEAHLSTGEMVEKRIMGLQNGVCMYTEEMPNNGTLSCEYPEELRMAVAQYLRDIAETDVFGVEVDGDLEGTTTTHTIDGVEVENPLQYATDEGYCVVSGY